MFQSSACCMNMAPEKRLTWVRKDQWIAGYSLPEVGRTDQKKDLDPTFRFYPKWELETKVPDPFYYYCIIGSGMCKVWFVFIFVWAMQYFVYKSYVEKWAAGCFPKNNRNLAHTGADYTVNRSKFQSRSVSKRSGSRSFLLILDLHL